LLGVEFGIPQFWPCGALKDGDTIRFGSVIAVFAGAYRTPSSSDGIRKFWMSISGKGAQPIAFAMTVSILKLGVSRNGCSPAGNTTRASKIRRDVLRQERSAQDA
jgi:hypothetical protein